LQIASCQGRLWQVAGPRRVVREVVAMAQAVGSDTFRQEVLEAREPVLVDFWATWCGPCRMLAPTIEKLSEQYAGRAKVVKVDVDQAPDLAAQYGVRSIPTVVLFHGGREAARWVGVQPPATYTQALDKLLG
jgi:thioredoxin 1